MLVSAADAPDETVGPVGALPPVPHCGKQWVNETGDGSVGMQVGMFFPGFHYEEITLAGTRYRLRTGGLAGWKAEPLLLLHGQPQTHAMWHQVAPALSDRFAVVCADLPSHLTVAELSHDMLGLMSRLGHRRFSVAGHDFGAHVAAAMAQSEPDRVARLAVIEAVPLPDHAGRNDMAFALSAYQTCWFAQRHPKPEALQMTAPDDWFRLVAPDEQPEIFHPEAVADYLLEGPWNESQRGHGAAADGPVPALDPLRTAARKIACPTLVLWSTRGRIGGWYDPRTLWAEKVGGPIEGGTIEGGHFLPEEAAWDVAGRLRGFLAPE